jgi:hypothetical protein
MISGGCFPLFTQHAAPGTAEMFTSGTSHGEAIGSYRREPLYHANLAPRLLERETRLALATSTLARLCFNNRNVMKLKG